MADGTVVTVGTFDGVHRGHWAVLAELVRVAREKQMSSTLVTFDPHPLRIVRPEHAPKLLTTPTEKIEILAQSEVDYVALVQFTKELSRYSPREFVARVLLDGLRMKHLVIGYDHGFGRGRSGDVDTLRELGQEVGFEVDVVQPVDADGEPISSSRIRAALVTGDVAVAEHALGRPYSMEGTVVRGVGAGRKLGFPTANLALRHDDKLVPHEGIYAVRAALHDRYVEGVLHLGPRPTFPGLPPSIELHLFDFDGDLYGRRIRVDFVARIRDIAKFANVKQLITAMGADCESARELLQP
ncbi:MAG: bifunctional riboflavin kinase/FAD synthetase [Longimicrobiales bacterium]